MRKHEAATAAGISSSDIRIEPAATLPAVPLQPIALQVTLQTQAALTPVPCRIW
jgi:hypothetical protein